MAVECRRLVFMSHIEKQGVLVEILRAANCAALRMITSCCPTIPCPYDSGRSPLQENPAGAF